MGTDDSIRELDHRLGPTPIGPHLHRADRDDVQQVCYVRFQRGAVDSSRHKPRSRTALIAWSVKPVAGRDGKDG